MDLLDIVQRKTPPAPWSEGEKIPWDDPEFSRRMLDEHLSQEHDAASRRAERIERQVSWIHNELLSAAPRVILDLGCGPGLYTSRLAGLGHRCVGIDFSPASIEYARTTAEARKLACRYLHQDIRTAEYGAGYGLVMLLFGEFNVFRRNEVEGILGKAFRSLAEGGNLLLEAHTFQAVKDRGRRPSRWGALEKGLFCEGPHVLLEESFWDDQSGAAVERYYVIDAATGRVSRHGQSITAYDETKYRRMLAAAGFEDVCIRPSMGEDAGDDDLLVITARKPEGACKN